jgi:hypothetical protein
LTASIEVVEQSPQLERQLVAQRLGAAQLEGARYSLELARDTGAGDSANGEEGSGQLMGGALGGMRVSVIYGCAQALEDAFAVVTKKLQHLVHDLAIATNATEQSLRIELDAVDVWARFDWALAAVHDLPPSGRDFAKVVPARTKRTLGAFCVTRR